MKTYPLQSISLETAMQFQFKMIDCITREFRGTEILTRGDLGVIPGINKPEATLKAERTIARFFNAEAAILVRGSGTGAIRYALFSCMKANDTLLIHTAPVYSTTKSTIEMLGLRCVRADFNNTDSIRDVMKQHPEIKGALVQYTRQSMEDRYDMEEVISTIKKCKEIPIITDDNYAVMKVEKIGSQCGGDLACFSCFKLLGPEGIGCIVGTKRYIDLLVKEHYSGGSQTQGWEAMEVLHGLVYAPVALAIQAETNKILVNRLKNNHEIPEIKDAFLANAQSKVLLVEFSEPIAKQVLSYAEELGALRNPVGAESKYEMCPLFYRVSGTYRASDPTLDDRMIRINPNRSGADTIIRILQESIKKVKACSCIK